MKITAALAFWNERPSDLIRCVQGIAQVADRIVALDGAYSRYPGADARPSSPIGQLRALRKAGEDAGLVVEIPWMHPQPWAGQVEKRAELLRLASEDSDWVVVVDTDHIIHANRAAVRAELETFRGDVIEVPLWTPSDPKRTIAEQAPSLWHAYQTGHWQPAALIYRSLPGMTVERFHWWVSAMKDGQRVWLWGGDDSRPHLPIRRLSAEYNVHHLCLYRTPAQIRASRGFINDREMVVRLTGQEDDRPDLPRPVFDYERLAAG